MAWFRTCSRPARCRISCAACFRSRPGGERSAAPCPHRLWLRWCRPLRDSGRGPRGGACGLADQVEPAPFQGGRPSPASRRRLRLGAPQPRRAQSVRCLIPHRKMRGVTHLIERTIDRDGQMLLIPKLEIPSSTQISTWSARLRTNSPPTIWCCPWPCWPSIFCAPSARRP